MRVEVDVFSGRPNPVWKLDEARSRELEQRFRGMTGSDAQPPAADLLGYRGIVVRGALGDCDELRLAGGVASARCGGETRVLADEGRALERWVLETGRGQAEVDEELFETLLGATGLG